MGLSGALRRLDDVEDGAGAVLVEDDGGNDGSAEGVGVGAVSA